MGAIAVLLGSYPLGFLLGYFNNNLRLWSSTIQGGTIVLA